MIASTSWYMFTLLLGFVVGLLVAKKDLEGRR